MLVITQPANYKVLAKQADPLTDKSGVLAKPVNLLAKRLELSEYVGPLAKWVDLLANRSIFMIVASSKYVTN